MFVINNVSVRLLSKEKSSNFFKTSKKVKLLNNSKVLTLLILRSLLIWVESLPRGFTVSIITDKSTLA